MAAPHVEEETDSKTYFRIHYFLPRATLKEVPNWRDGVMDECVERALKRDLMPVGEVLLEDPQDVEPDAGQTQVQLPEGIRFEHKADQDVGAKPMRIDENAFMEGFLGQPMSVSVAMVKVTAEVMLS